LDSDACFASLLGNESNGHWSVAPTEETISVSRRYRAETLLLETLMETASGSVRIIDFMPIRDEHPILMRIVRGVSGTVRLRSTLSLRFGYGRIKPYFTHTPEGYHAQAGPDAVLHVGPQAPVDVVNGDLVSEFEVRPGESLALQCVWYRPWDTHPRPRDPFVAERTCEQWWRDWAATATCASRNREAVVRSLITLKALTYAPTGAVAAAATTSLPEEIGGERNWDYRYTWLRDASMTLQALLLEGYREEAYAFRDWVMRAVAGDPEDMQIMYSITGKRHLPEWTVPWLEGYEGSAPVRIGNGAADQFQLDVYGELSDAAYSGRTMGVTAPRDAGTTWGLQQAVARFVEQRWRDPDEGIWEVRGAQQHFTYSKVMAWVAIDRTARTIKDFELDGDEERWRSLADEIHADICANGIDPERNCFTQAYGNPAMDASLLMIPLVGFLPPDDERIINTVHEVEKELSHEGLMARYLTQHTDDGLAGEEGAFLICSFWFVECLVLIGEKQRAQELFDHLVGLANDVGLLSEEYDPIHDRMLGNMPQAFSHLGRISAAHALDGALTKPR
jgi:GH15 family glucan-1,4-alpha-glucosidase